MLSGSTKEKIMTNWPSEKELERARNEHSTGIASRPLTKNASKSEKLKHLLCSKFIIYKQEKKLTGRAMAEIIGIKESLISKILHYHYDEFSSDRLLEFLSKIYPDFKLNIDLAA
jgi:predicted XRE-type DNA-binding protein